MTLSDICLDPKQRTHFLTDEEVSVIVRDGDFDQVYRAMIFNACQTRELNHRYRVMAYERNRAILAAAAAKRSV